MGGERSNRGVSRNHKRQVQTGNDHFLPQNCKLHADGTTGPSLSCRTLPGLPGTVLEGGLWTASGGDTGNGLCELILKLIGGLFLYGSKTNFTFQSSMCQRARAEEVSTLLLQRKETGPHPKKKVAPGTCAEERLLVPRVGRFYL